jgi:Raf kinase inhibitor-like YbhB/YbcL family protein
MKRLLAALFLASAFALNAADAVFTLESSTFKDGGALPLECAMKAAGGKNLSPALSWRNPPPGTKFFALLCVDKDPMAQNWIHWIALNIPVAAPALQEGDPFKGLVRGPGGVWELANSFKTAGWGGPMPPPGSGPHSYEFSLYALSEKLALHVPYNAAFSERYLLECMEGKILGKASITGTYERR